jgi:tripartite-type tricarboxylate transporter receptor subunit TctC
MISAFRPLIAEEKLMSQTLIRTAATALMIFTAATVSAQSWPTRPVRMIVPYTDLLARAVGERLGAAIGQSIVIDNRPGANTIIGYQLQAAAAPDGYTLIMGGFNALVMNPLLYKSLPYNVDRDLAHIGLVGISPLVVVAHPSLPARNLKELVAYAQTNPGKLNFASSGNGNITHIAGELFMSMAGIQMQHIAYKGGSASMADQLTGVIQLKFDTPITALPFIRDGKLRALAVTSRKRMSSLPDVLTAVEQGYKDYEAATWFSIATRKGTPQPVIDKLSGELARIVQLLEMRTRFGAVAIEMATGSPTELGQLVKHDTQRWAAVIKKSGVTLDP